jgi:hypothetical protein
VTTIRERLRRWLGRSPGHRLTAEAALTLARELESTQEVEFDCDQVHRLMDQFAEAVQRGQDGAPWVSLIRAHLEKCGDCRQEFEALLRVLQSSWA